MIFELPIPSFEMIILNTDSIPWQGWFFLGIFTSILVKLFYKLFVEIIYHNSWGGLK